MTNLDEYLGGRIFNAKELDLNLQQELINLGALKTKSICQVKGERLCRRCLMKLSLKPKKYDYCRYCINLGKINTSDDLLITSSDTIFPAQEVYLNWNGKLTANQQRGVHELLNAFEHHQDHLVWAVTGAGKTEMIFPLIERALINRQRIAICSPRVDVCIELFPRLQKVFPTTTIGLFHGKSLERYHLTQISVMTVHQLVRFEKAFDVLIIDEVDSYPLAGNQMLHQAIKKSRKEIGMTVYLSATPPKEILKKVELGQITLSKLYQRFHGHPLPEPHCHLLFKEIDFLGINPRLRLRFEQVMNNQLRLMIFFPSIPVMERFAKKLKQYYPNLSFVSVSSLDKRRLEKVQQFREKQVQVILTTTILERGVTFKRVMVLVLNADAKEFSKTSLIQIAGRAGRDKKYFDDEVHFYYHYYNQQIYQACKEIKYLNRQVKK
ncbi:DEAD/DEAH box helicase family protein [Companilactobacillus sp. HBUAS56275]|uniref:DEAD/DEAH box helicase family protein n=1 Tax=Candidatus Companilactobacillus pullicola TaxID=2838523 RepID=A0A9D1ZMN4_9LACO|nr:DEAD/DEAH box helicase family protein [Candidatus Companilactobacillus pullicola]